MDYRNADGSIAEMCGNGVRVFARYLVANGLADARPEGLPVATRAGVVRAVVDGDDDRGRTWPPRGVRARAPATIGSLTFPGVAVDCGNPHLVCGLHDAWLAVARPDVAPGFDPALFPAGVNVEFVVPAAPVDGADLHVADAGLRARLGRDAVLRLRRAGGRRGGAARRRAGDRGGGRRRARRPAHRDRRRRGPVVAGRARRCWSPPARSTWRRSSDAAAPRRAPRLLGRRAGEHAARPGRRGPGRCDATSSSTCAPPPTACRW